MKQTTTREKVFGFLCQNRDEYRSGQEIADALGLSRNAVWKAVHALMESGYEIESRTNRGYRLVLNNRTISQELVSLYTTTECDLRVLEQVGSTNDVVKEAVIGDIPVVVTTHEQTAGRGRLGRPFQSPAGTGIYLSIGIKPKFDISQSLYVTMAAAVAVCRAIKRVTGVEADIKWVNDLFLNGKKLCGILTEGQTNFETGMIDRLIIGIGLNCFEGSYPEELNDILTTLSTEAGEFSRPELIGAMIDEVLTILEDIESKHFLDEYRRRCFILGREVLVHPSLQKEGFLARALQVTEDGGLEVVYLEGPDQGRKHVVHTGEISVHLV